jgi:hypothetical protein
MNMIVSCWIFPCLAEEARALIECFTTTRIYFPIELEKEEVRMLTTAFRCKQTFSNLSYCFWLALAATRPGIAGIHFIILLFYPFRLSLVWLPVWSCL